MEGVSGDAPLVERAQRGDRDAFAGLVREYQQPLAGYLFHLLGDWELALDSTQETFVRAYTALGATRASLAIRPWLFRIATNLAYDGLRHRRRIAWVPLALAENHSTSDQIGGVEEREVVRLALASLRSDEQAVLVLCAVEQQTYKEIADILGGSPEAIRKRFSRAKDRFRVAYLEMSGETRQS